MPCSLPLPNGLSEDLYQDLFSYFFVILHEKFNMSFRLFIHILMLTYILGHILNLFSYLLIFVRNCFSSPSKSICNNMIAILLEWRICFQFYKYLLGTTHIQSNHVQGHIMVNTREVEGCLPEILLRK